MKSLPGKASYLYVEKTFRDPFLQELIQNAVAVEACGPVINTTSTIGCSSAALANAKPALSGIFNILLQSDKK